MKIAFAGQRTFLLVAALALGTFAAHAGAQSSGYLTDKHPDGSSKSVVRSGTNLCWHTGAWPAGIYSPECAPGVVRQTENRSPPAEKRPAQAAAPAEKRPTQAAVPASPVQDSGSGLAPETSVPTEVAYVAPVVLEKIILSADMLFDIDKSVIKPAGKAELDKLVDKLDGNLRVVLPVGHTSSPGGDAHNMALSNRRADAVKAYLVAQGIDADRIHPSGKGENNPVATNATVAGRALNRRVEIEVMGTPADQKW